MKFALLVSSTSSGQMVCPIPPSCTLQFENGLHSVTLHAAVESADTWVRESYAVLRNLSVLKEVVTKSEDPNAEEMVAAVMPKLQELEGRCTHGKVENVIRRNSDEDYKYSARVHRDIDEVALSNLQSSDAFNQGVVNVWVPLVPLGRDTLAWLSGNQFNLDFAAPFFDVSPSDATGLNFDPKLSQWTFAPNLKPGDCVVWKSHLVYHSAAELPEGPGGRRSVDFRLYF